MFSTQCPIELLDIGYILFYSVKAIWIEINENLSINGDNSSINNSDSEHEFMDLEVQGVCNAKTIETNVL